MAVDPQRLQTAKKRLEDDPYDLESWMLVIKNAQSKRIEDSRPIYERLLTVFPTSGRFWKVYIEQEMRARNFEKVEKLFQRSLMKVLHIDLWKTYLTYVKETKCKLPTYKEKMAQAYDFALDKMGMDISSYTLWNDYIKFLKGVEAVGSYLENQKISAIRKVYQRGIVNPMVNIEQFWKDYVTFEQGINPIIAEKMTSERSRDYMNARRVAKEYEACTRGLNKVAPCIPPTGSADEAKQIDLWQKYISWERSNPLRVEDQVVIAKRVMFAYEQSLLCLGHHANIWYEAAMFLQESSKQLAEKGDVDSSKTFLEQASALFERATGGILKRSMLLHFAYADFEEQQMKLDKVHQVYKKFLEIEDVDPTLCYIQYMKFCRRSESTQSARGIFKKARDDPRTTHQAYVAAALMEYYCTKDKKIASNVFELGFKKYKACEEYILAYMDYLSHLNEDNNTRVLFERALTSGSLKPEQQMSIWNKFLEFESNIGDMASIIKVERRRAQALEQEVELSETSQLIDRYKFLQLYPCSQEELRLLNYQNLDHAADATGSRSLLLTPAAKHLTNGSGVGATGAFGEGDKYPRPDTSQMIPFKPKVHWTPGEHPAPGGGFPLPPAAALLCQSLPPPSCFQGPFVMVDRLCELIVQMTPDEAPATSADGGKHYSSKLFELAKSVHWIKDHVEGGGPGGVSGGAGGVAGGTGAGEGGRKRRGGDESDDDDDESNMAPKNDIYRKRQQKKIR